MRMRFSEFQNSNVAMWGIYVRCSGIVYAHTNAVDGNKNVSEVLDESGNIVAHYEYAAFGDAVIVSGEKALANSFRFSSEYADDALGLTYYNYRHLDHAAGRWLSRDPIEEQGGWNLYGMVDNALMLYFDILGLNSNVTIKYYDIKNLSERPFDGKYGKWTGKAVCNIKDFVMGNAIEVKNGKCRAGCAYKAKARFKIECFFTNHTIHLPRFKNMASISNDKDTVRLWKDFLERLKAHENRHFELAKNSNTSNVFTAVAESCNANALRSKLWQEAEDKRIYQHGLFFDDIWRKQDEIDKNERLSLLIPRDNYIVAVLLNDVEVAFR